MNNLMDTQWCCHANGIAWEMATAMQQRGFIHGVTGKMGGVSHYPYESLNLALHVGDNPKDVLENRRRLCHTIGCKVTDMTFAKQTHMDHIVAVGPAECGSGAGSYDSALDHTDALMTDHKNMPLFICVADCVPVILYDYKRHACAVIHAGWRGSAANIVTKTVFAMSVVYGSNPQNIFAFIGPSISASHFEVSRTTALIFKDLGEAYHTCVKDEAERRTVDLWQVNYLQLVEEGIDPAHITVTKQCVFSQERRFFSYRRDGGTTGRMVAFAMLQ